MQDNPPERVAKRDAGPRRGSLLHNRRLLSLDALRGFDMLLIMGLGEVIIALCAVLGFGTDCALARQFSHVAWDGLRFEDTIFPLFLFLYFLYRKDTFLKV